MIYINDKEYGMAWQGSAKNQICVDIPHVAGSTLSRGYHSFPDKDSCVNYLFLGGHKELARLINAKF